MKFYFSLISLKKSLIYAFLFFLASCTSSIQQTSPQQNKTSLNRLSIPLAPLSQWSERKFVGSTDYQIISEPSSKSTILSAKSNQSASLLFKKMPIDLNKTPYINWQWKVQSTYANNFDETKKNGDDFPARIYIAIKPQLGHIKPRALTYVWASHAKKLSHWKNPFAKTVEILALQSGDEFSGRWINEKRNLKEDLSKLFGQSIDSIEGIGIMTDTDNSKTTGEAQYQTLFFSSN